MFEGVSAPTRCVARWRAIDFADDSDIGLPSIIDTMEKAEKIASSTPSTAYTAFVVITWFALNMTIANLNKWIFHRYPFKYPAALTMCHMVTSYVMSDATLRVRGQIAKKLSSKTKFAVTQLSLVFVVSVAAGNAALGYIHVSFAQAIGATAPLWTVLLSVLLTRKSYPPLVYAALGLISVGMLLTVRGEVNFHAIGFALVLTATLTRALKSILQGLLLSSPEERLDPIELLYHMAYRSAIALGLYAFVMERGLLSDPNVREPMLWLCVLASSVVAFALNLSQFLVTKATSAVTLQVCFTRAKSIAPFFFCVLLLLS